ncbi:MAG TPA: P1 family peptidase [Paracoccaceae bacterium]|nr:P1 family peptidase [Paracoccaceae bacterium]
MRPGPLNLLTDVAGILVGNAEAPDFLSGTTVVLAEGRAVAAVDVRGGGPGTRETDVIAPGALTGTVDAVVLSGGSAYGLDAASGVAEWLRDRGRGLAVAGSLVPIVPAAILFDLSRGLDPSRPGTPLPYRELGQLAAEGAGPSFRLGNEGAGLGATTAGAKGGLGSASLVWERPGAQPWTVGAIVAANALGSALIPGTRHFRAAPFEQGAEFGGLGLPPKAPQPAAIPSKRPLQAGANTTIALVATDAPLGREDARRLAIMAQDGIALAIHPAHTPFDGDAVFALATGRAAGPVTPEDLYVLGAMASICLARAIARGIFEAETVVGIPAWRDLA